MNKQYTPVYFSQESGLEEQKNLFRAWEHGWMTTV